MGDLVDILKDQEVQEMAIESISQDRLLKLIGDLPEKYRLVFNLYILDSYSHKDISRALSISEGTSKSNLSRAKKILQEKIKEYLKEELF